MNNQNPIDGQLTIIDSEGNENYAKFYLLWNLKNLVKSMLYFTKFQN